MNKVKEFFKQAAEVKVAKPAPKFSVGDYIVNTKYKIISKVLDILNVFENEDRTVNYDVAQYLLEDLKNEVRDKGMAEGNEGMLYHIQPVRIYDNRVYKRTKPVHSIDAFYHKMNPEAAQALYGKKTKRD